MPEGQQHIPTPEEPIEGAFQGFDFGTGDTTQRTEEAPNPMNRV